MRENATIGLKEKVKRLKPPHTSRQRQSKDTDTGPPPGSIPHKGAPGRVTSYSWGGPWSLVHQVAAPPALREAILYQ